MGSSDTFRPTLVREVIQFFPTLVQAVYASLFGDFPFFVYHPLTISKNRRVNTKEESVARKYAG